MHLSPSRHRFHDSVKLCINHGEMLTYFIETSIYLGKTLLDLAEAMGHSTGQVCNRRPDAAFRRIQMGFC